MQETVETIREKLSGVGNKDFWNPIVQELMQSLNLDRPHALFLLGKAKNIPSGLELSELLDIYRKEGPKALMGRINDFIPDSENKFDTGPSVPGFQNIRLGLLRYYKSRNALKYDAIMQYPEWGEYGDRET